MLLAFSPRPIPQAFLLAVAALLLPLGVLCALPRIRPDRCVHCGYDLRVRVAAAPRCPECGQDPREPVVQMA